MTPTERQSEVDRIATREARDRREKERSVVALERIADALETRARAATADLLEALEPFASLADRYDCREDLDVAYVTVYSLRRARDVARRSRNQGDDNG